MSKLLQFLLSQSILLPFIASIIRFKTTPKEYYPLVFILWIGVINEAVNFLFFPANNAVPVNIYCLLEFIFLCWQFKNWQHIFSNYYGYLLLVVSVCLFYFVDNIFLQKITGFTSTFLIVYPFIIVLLAVNELNYLVINYRDNLLFNAIFIFCVATILFFSYRVLSEIFYHYANGSDIKINIFSIQAYMNVLFNILYTLAILCLPKRKIFIQPYW